MTSRRAAFLLWFLVLASLRPLRAQEADGRTVQGPPPPNPGSDCPGRPVRAQPVEFRVLRTERIRTPKPEGPEAGSIAESTRNLGHGLNLQGPQEIRDESSYQGVFGEPSSGIDWTSSRVAVVTLRTTYRLGQLDSRVTFAGISQTAEAIYVGLTFTQIGPCQGISQKGERLSTDQLLYFVVLPLQPSRIITYMCVVGGCPKGIP